MYKMKCPRCGEEMKNSKLENPLPTGVVLNNIIDNKIVDKFTARL